MRSKKWLLAGLVFVISGCASSDLDGVWTPADERAAAQLEAQAESQPEAAPLQALEADDLDEAPPSNAPLLEVYVFNIGQADSMLVVGPAPRRRTMLVDLGQRGGGELPDDFVSGADTVLRRIQEITGENGVDYFVLSHYHADHAGRGLDPPRWGTGIIQVLSDFQTPFHVGEFIHVQNGGLEFMDDSETARGVFKTIQRRMAAWQRAGRVGLSSTPRFGTTQINLGSGVDVDILAFAGTTPGGSAMERARNEGADYDRAPASENDLSIALQVTAGEFELFSAGDLSGTDDPDVNPFSHVTRNGDTYTNVEDFMVRHWQSESRESDVEIYRANHHGSANSTTQTLLDALDPEFVIYSTGAQYGHPDSTIVRRVRPTAAQLATTAAANDRAFRRAGGAVVGEIQIIVARDGRSYTLNGTRHTAFTNAAEANGDDE